jgi:heptosyltransferase-2
LRTTLVLRLEDQFDKIFWFTSSQAMPLIQSSEKVIVDVLKNIHNYANIICHKETLVINLEKKIIENLEFIINENRYIGFIFKGEIWQLKDYQQVLRPLDEWAKFITKNKKETWGEQLTMLMGFDLKEKFGILNKYCNTEKRCDIGLNWQVGAKWKSKQLPMSTWKMIESSLSQEYSICWQQGMNQLDDYIDWIAGCRLIVTTDSLGLHLAIVLGIPIVAYFSITSSREIDHHQAVSFLQFNSEKEYDEVNRISLDKLHKSVKELLK